MKKMLVILLILAFVLSLVACGQNAEIKPVTMKIGMLKGPTGMGMAKMLEEGYVLDKNIETEVLIAAAPDELTAKLISGEVQIAAVPTNLAAVLYNKTKGEVQIAAVNALGNLFVVTNGVEIKEFADLAGKTITTVGQGATPEYALNYMLDKAGIKDKVKINYIAEPSELATMVAGGAVGVAVLPEPFVSVVTMKDINIQSVLNLNDEWNKLNNNQMMAMGCIVVNKKFAEENKAAVNKFLTEYEKSVAFVNKDTAAAAKIIESRGILANAAVAEKAIPNSAIVYKDATANKEAINAYLKILYTYNPASVGGALPDDDFYYKK